MGTSSITKRLIILALPLLLYFTVLGRSKLFNDADTFWHIAVGRVTLESGFIHEDHYSFTRYGEPWLANQWLAECMLALADSLGGLDGVLALTVAVLMATYLVLAYRWLASGFDPLLTLTFVALILSASAYTINARPHLASIGLLGCMFVLLRNAEDKQTHPTQLIWLVPLFVLWSNVHGGVLGGLGTLILAAAGWTALLWLRTCFKIAKAVSEPSPFGRGQGEGALSSVDTPSPQPSPKGRGRISKHVLKQPTPLANTRDALHLWLIVTACVFALFATPYGAGSLEAWRAIMSMSLPDLIIEHAPLEVRSPQGALVVVVCIIYMLVFAATPRAWLRPTFWLPLVWFVLTCQRIRHAPLFAIVAGIAMADLLPMSRLAPWLVRRHWLRAQEPAPSGKVQGEGASQPSPNGRGRISTHALTQLAMIVLISTAPLLGAAIWLKHVGPLPLIGDTWARPTPRVWPRELIEPLTAYAAEHPADARVFNEPILGGFLIYNFPTLRVFMDGRCELYGEPMLKDFVAAWRDPSLIGRWQQKYGFRAAVIESNSPLRRYFDNEAPWQLVAETTTARFYRMQEDK